MPPQRLRPEPDDSLDTQDAATTRSPRSGRPLRKAQRRIEYTQFVCSTDAVSDSAESASSDDGDTVVSHGRKRKRKSSPGPSPQAAPLLVPAKQDHAHTDNEYHKERIAAQWARQHALIVGMYNALADENGRSESPPPDPSVPSKAKHCMFLELPRELRDEIYSHLYVADQPLRFSIPQNFQFGTGLLRSCKRINEEVCSMLYGQNHFILNRQSRQEGSYWTYEWTEVGFKAIQRWVRSIGAKNLSLLNHVSLSLEDATPWMNQQLLTPDSRRFVNDDILLDVLNVLAATAHVKRLTLHFFGRRRLERGDRRFLGALWTIRAEEIEFVSSAIHRQSKHDPWVEQMCLAKMREKRPEDF